MKYFIDFLTVFKSAIIMKAYHIQCSFTHTLMVYLMDHVNVKLM
jgi:hypothetical protein